MLPTQPVRPRIAWTALIMGALLACQGPSTPATGTGAVFVNDGKFAEGRIDRTTPNTFAMEGADVGMDLGTPVTEDYTSHLSRFNGRIHGVTIELK